MQSVTSSRSFGLVIAGLFLAFAILDFCGHGHAYIYWGAACCVVLVIAILMPRTLSPLKRVWLKLGSLLHRFVSPVVLGLTYAVAIVPIGLLIRIFGRDLLSERHDKSAASYWRRRSAGGPAPESLRDQF